jgi:IS6 family transposase
MDATYMKAKGQWRSLERAGDTHGQTMDLLLTEQRDKEAALRLPQQALRRPGLPETITLDGSDPKAAALKSDTEAHGTAPSAP